MVDKILRNITVRITDSTQKLLGTGMLWMHQEDQDNFYVFTAAHVLVNCENSIKIEFCLDGIIYNYDVDKAKIKYHNKFIEKLSDCEFDAAVIVVGLKNQNIYFDYNIYTSKNTLSMEAETYGFSNASNVKDNILVSGIPLKGYFVDEYDVKTQHTRFRITTALDQADKSSELKGVSGAPLLIGNEDEIIFMGIVIGGHGFNATTNIVRCASATLFIEIIDEIGGVKLDNESEAIRSFHCVRDNVVCDFKQGKVKDYLTASIDSLIEKHNITPQKLLDIHDDCYDIPTCFVQHKQRCKVRWTNKLFLLSLLHIVKTPLEDLQRPIIKINEELSIPLEFVCSEGKSKGIHINNLIHSIEEKRQLGLEVLRNGSTLIWSSKGTPFDTALTRDEYKGIIFDIKNTPAYFFDKREKTVESETSLDVFSGNINDESYSIIHIYKLQEKLNKLDKNCTIDEIIECIKGAILDVS